MNREPVSPAVILVVDDEEVLARLMIRFLRHLGYTVYEARCGEQALSMVQERRPPIDLVLWGANLEASKGRHGIGLIMAMLAECPGLQVIRATGRRTDLIGWEGHRIGVLRKPLDLDELQRLLRLMLPNLLPVEECDAVPCEEQEAVRPRQRASPASLGASAE